MRSVVGLVASAAFLAAGLVSPLPAADPTPQAILEEAVAALPKTGGGVERQNQLSFLAECFAQAGDVSSAVKLIQQIKNTRAAGLQEQAYESIALVQSARREFAAALETAARLNPPVKRASILAEVAHEQLRAGQKPEAEKTLKTIQTICTEASEVIEKRHKANPKLENADLDIDDAAQLALARESLLRVQVLLGQVDAARQTAKEVYADRDDRGASILADIFAEAGRFPEAIAQAQTIAEELPRLFSFCQIAERQIAAKDKAGAESLVKKISDYASGLAAEPTDDEERHTLVARLLSHQVILQVRLGQTESALALCRKIGDLAARSGALCEAAKALHAAGDAKRAQDSLREAFTAALHASDEVEGLREQGESLEKLARTHAEIGDLDGALRVFGWLNALDERDAVARALIEVVAEQKRYDSIPNLLAWVVSRHERALALQSLARVYARQERVSAALDLARQQKDWLSQSQALAGVAIGLLEKQGQYHPLKKPTAEDLERLIDPFR